MTKDLQPDLDMDPMPELGLGEHIAIWCAIGICCLCTLAVVCGTLGYISARCAP